MYYIFIILFYTIYFIFYYYFRSYCKRYGIQIIVLALVIAGVTIALVFGMKKDVSDHVVGAVASNGEECAEIGG